MKALISLLAISSSVPILATLHARVVPVGADHESRDPRRAAPACLSESAAVAGAWPKQALIDVDNEHRAAGVNGRIDARQRSGENRGDHEPKRSGRKRHAT